MSESPDIQEILVKFNSRKFHLTQWKNRIINILEDDSTIHELEPILIKGRIKGETSLINKVVAKHKPPHRRITPENLFEEIEDVVGARLVVAEKRQVVSAVHQIRKLEQDGVWKIMDEIHYVWHPDDIRGVQQQGLNAEISPVSYCSRHFILVGPETDLDDPKLVKCELQVRTILEEAIFENDHRIRYKPTHGELTNHHGDITKRVLSRLIELLETADRLLVDAYEVAEQERDQEFRPID